jgi:hypothetical protein
MAWLKIWEIREKDETTSLRELSRMYSFISLYRVIFGRKVSKMLLDWSIARQKYFTSPIVVEKTLRDAMRLRCK